jgi:hypothetical protein
MVRIAGWIVVAAVAVVLVVPAAARASDGPSFPHQAAVEVYVEEFPTAGGSVPADVAVIAAAGASRNAGPPGSSAGGLIGLALVLAGVTAVVVAAWLRRERRRS